MKENLLYNMAQLVQDEKPDLPNDSSHTFRRIQMLDKSTDTLEDSESSKRIPCTCRIFDSSTEVNVLPSGTTHIEQECHCLEQKDKTFLDAVFTGNFELLEMCLDNNADFNVTDQYYNTALHMVSHGADTEMLKFLLNTNLVDVNVQNLSGLTPMMIAIMNSHEESVKLLLENGANPNIKDKNGRTGLFYSVIAENIEMTKLLLRYGAEMNIIDSFGNTPISMALDEHLVVNIVQALLSSGADIMIQNRRLNPFLETVLSCSNNQRLRVVKLLVEAGVDVNILEPYSKRNCLHLNAINGYLRLAEYLVKQGADLEQADNCGRTPHLVASEHNNTEVANFFEEALWLRRIIRRRMSLKLNRRSLELSRMFPRKNALPLE